MNVFEFVIIVIVLSLIYKLFSGWMRHRAQAPAEEPARAALLKRLDEVEDRVRVLERIVTDERFDLKQQFKELER